MKAIIHSTKHYVQHSIATATAGAVLNGVISSAVAVVDKNVPTEVEEGTSVKAVYVEIWVRAGSATGASGQFIIYKRGGDSTNPSAIDMAALNDWDNKKNIFYTTMGLFNDQDADAIAVFKGWVKIPKGKQRQGLGDVLAWAIFAPTIDLHVCGFETYKEYS